MHDPHICVDIKLNVELISSICIQELSAVCYYCEFGEVLYLTGLCVNLCCRHTVGISVIEIHCRPSVTTLHCSSLYYTSCELIVACKVFYSAFDIRLHKVPLFTDNTVVSLQSSDAAVRSGFASSCTI